METWRLCGLAVITSTSFLGITSCGIRHLQIAVSIVHLAFGILFGGIVFALALAIGLGSKELVSRSLERETSKVAGADAENRSGVLTRSLGQNLLYGRGIARMNNRALAVKIRTDQPHPDRRYSPVPFVGPGIDQVQLEILNVSGALPMTKRENGWPADHRAGDAWRSIPFILRSDAGTRTRHRAISPKNIHGPSELVNPEQWSWSDGGWSGRPWEEAVIYELHLGTFTPEGTFRAAIGKLEHLEALGIDRHPDYARLRLPGSQNWGYDGVSAVRTRIFLRPARGSEGAGGGCTFKGHHGAARRGL